MAHSYVNLPEGRCGKGHEKPWTKPMKTHKFIDHDHCFFHFPGVKTHRVFHVDVQV